MKAYFLVLLLAGLGMGGCTNRFYSRPSMGSSGRYDRGRSNQREERREERRENRNERRPERDDRSH